MGFLATLRQSDSIILPDKSLRPGLQTKAVRCHIPLGGFALFKLSSNKAA
jgi:hypothetical protein